MHDSPPGQRRPVQEVTARFEGSIDIPLDQLSPIDRALRLATDSELKKGRLHKRRKDRDKRCKRCGEKLIFGHYIAETKAGDIVCEKCVKV